MRAFLIATVAAALVGFGGYLAADDSAPAKTGSAPEKQISSPFLDSLIGNWTTEGVAKHDGHEMKSTGKSTFAKGLGQTALFQSYESIGPGPDGGSTTFYGHGVTKIASDGKTATTWWFCNMSSTALVLTGTLSDNVLELKGTSPKTGNPMTVTFKKGADGGLTFTMTDGEEEMTDTYKRAR
jgi:hypothetical protein